MTERPGQDRDWEQRVIEELIDEHVRVDCTLIQIDADTWAIHGTIVVDGQVIMAEFSSQAATPKQRSTKSSQEKRRPRVRRTSRDSCSAYTTIFSTRGWE